MKRSRYVVDWAFYLVPWITIAIWIVLHNVWGPPCFSPTCPEDTRNPGKADLVVLVCGSVLFFWCAWWLAGQASRAMRRYDDQ